jgi:glucans biosynthesis protein C
LYFLSGLFVWPSLKRKGSGLFLRHRLLRLGLPFVVVVGCLMPLAHYATYRARTVDASLVVFWRHWIALPFWPSGPPWFLWLLLVFDAAAAALYRLAPGSSDSIARSLTARTRPISCFAVLSAASAVAYVPLALAFSPWAWFEYGPFAFQLSRPAHYAVYFFIGVGVGAYGIERDPFAAKGKLAQGWFGWVVAALALFLLWISVTVLALRDPAATPLAVRVGADLSFSLACAASCFAVVAFFLRFASRRMSVIESLAGNAYGLYLVHYVFVLWLQYLLLDAPLPAVAKFLIVLGLALLLSLAATTALQRIPAAARVIGTDRRASAKAR